MCIEFCSHEAEGGCVDAEGAVEEEGERCEGRGRVDAEMTSNGGDVKGGGCVEWSGVLQHRMPFHVSCSLARERRSW